MAKTNGGSGMIGTADAERVTGGQEVGRDRTSQGHAVNQFHKARSHTAAKYWPAKQANQSTHTSNQLPIGVRIRPQRAIKLKEQIKKIGKNVGRGQRAAIASAARAKEITSRKTKAETITIVAAKRIITSHVRPKKQTKTS